MKSDCTDNSSNSRFLSNLNDGERYYKCNYCHKSFTRPSSLQMHHHFHSRRKQVRHSRMRRYVQKHQRTSSTIQILSVNQQDNNSALPRKESRVKKQEVSAPQYYRHHVFVLPVVSCAPGASIYQHQALPLAEWETPTMNNFFDTMI